MTPVQVKRDETSDIMWLCTSCNHTWSELEDAEACCNVLLCRECRRSVIGGRSLCSECAINDREHLEHALYSKASKVYYMDYEEPLFYWSQGGPVGRFFRTRTELDTFCENAQSSPPRWAWATSPSKLVLDARKFLTFTYPNILEFVEESPVEELQKQLDSWTSTLEVKEHKIDYNVVVILDRQLLEEFTLPTYDDIDE